MTIRLARSLAAAAALAAAVPFATTASAQPAAGIAVGMQVVDTAGNPVGTVIARSGDMLTVKTDRHEVALPSSSFTPSEGKLLFGMTQAQLNASTDQALAAAAATVAIGAEVRGTGGEVAGTIDAIDTQTITLKLASGEKVRLPKDAVAGTPNGPVLGVTVEELKAMASKAAEAQSAEVAAAAGTEPTAEAAE